MNRVAKIEQVQNGYVVTTYRMAQGETDLEKGWDEKRKQVYNTFEEGIDALRFYFDVKKEAG